jgi:hypothetical protein
MRYGSTRPSGYGLTHGVDAHVRGIGKLARADCESVFQGAVR